MSINLASGTGHQAQELDSKRQDLYGRFRAGVAYFLASPECDSPPEYKVCGRTHYFDRDYFWQLCDETFECLLERGRGECLVDRQRKVIKHVPHHATLVAKSAIRHSYFRWWGSEKGYAIPNGRRNYTESRGAERRGL